MTSLPAEKATRKRLGAWYTPPSIVRPLVRWAVRRPDDRVLDPAVGDGAFLLEAAARLTTLGGDEAAGALLGLDVNPDAVRVARQALASLPSAKPEFRVLDLDFFQVHAPGQLLAEFPSFDAVVGNPPYIRYQSFSGEVRRSALRRAEEAGARLDHLCSSWAPFVVHAVSFLKRGGRLAFVLPEELTHARYAGEVRAFLRRRFRTTAVLSFEGHRFPSSQERVLLLLAEGKDEASAGELRLATVGPPGALDDLDRAVRNGERFAPRDQPEKWEVRFDDGGSSILHDLVSDGRLVPLRSVGKASIGYVSGANDFFILKPSEARAWKFSPDLLRPTLIAARQCPGAVYTTREFRGMLLHDERCLLWEGAGSGTKAVSAYLRMGIARGIAGRYKCRVREPWYRVPGVVRPQAFLTYMSDRWPRLILNRARVSCSNNLLAVRLPGVDRGSRQALVTLFYNSATLLSAERIGRRYGGGVLKLEPSEADSLLLPAPALLGGIPDAGDGLREADELLRRKEFERLRDRIDGLFLGEVCGLAPGEIRELQASWTGRHKLRKGTRRSLDWGVSERRRAARPH
jgi:methylase of polypeptide subunit release factors